MAGAGKDNDSLDVTVLSTMADASSPTFVAEIVSTFITDTEERFRHIKVTAPWTGESLASFAHYVKGGAAQVGAIQLSKLCRNLEVAAKSNGTSNDELLVAQLEEEFEHVRVLLEDLVSQLS